MDLSEYSILVGGPYWGDCLQNVKNFHVVDKVISPVEFESYYRSARIGINFHGTNCKSGLNNRTFDISATGEFQVYVAEPRAYEWDIAAGHAILKNSGGTVTDFDGNNILYGKNGFKNPSIFLKSTENI